MATKREESTELAPKEMTMPAYMQKFLQNNQSDAASMATASMSVPRLSYRGKRFRFVENGEEEIVKSLTVDVVILGVEPDAGKFVKTYYEKGYEPGSSDPPTCSSSNGISPDSWCTSKQANYCSQCAKNVFGSATSSVSGGKSKACKDSKRLWVAKSDDFSKYYGLNVPVMSLKNLSEYGKYIGKNNYPLSLVVTRVSMDDNTEFPKLCFEHVGFVNEENSEAVIKINNERPWKSTFADMPMVDHAVSADGPSTKHIEPTREPAAPGDEGTLDDAIKAW